MSCSHKKKSKIHYLIQQYLHCDGVPNQMLHQEELNSKFNNIPSILYKILEES